MTNQALAKEIVNVYSYRSPDLIKPLFAAFRNETGIEVNYLFLKTGMIERLVAEGRNTPADIILTSGIDQLYDLKQTGLTRPILLPALQNAIPAHLRDSENHWFALTLRARVIYASRSLAKQARPVSYLSLADKQWRGRICSRSGRHPYMNALIASMIANHGYAKAQIWLEGVKNNLARKPQGNDRAQIRAIWSGECDIALANTYYFGKILENPAQRIWASSVLPIFPSQAQIARDPDFSGTHVNISAIAMARHAPNVKNGEKLMQFLISPRAQKIYAETNYEYPARVEAQISPVVASWGELTPDPLPLAEIARNRHLALRLVNSLAFDDGPK